MTPFISIVACWWWTLVLPSQFATFFCLSSCVSHSASRYCPLTSIFALFGSSLYVLISLWRASFQSRLGRMTLVWVWVKRQTCFDWSGIWRYMWIVDVNVCKPSCLLPTDQNIPSGTHSLGVFALVAGFTKENQDADLEGLLQLLSCLFFFADHLHFIPKCLLASFQVPFSSFPKPYAHLCPPRVALILESWLRRRPKSVRWLAWLSLLFCRERWQTWKQLWLRRSSGSFRKVFRKTMRLFLEVRLVKSKHVQT